MLTGSDLALLLCSQASTMQRYFFDDNPRKVLLGSSEVLRSSTTRRASSFRHMCIGGFGRYAGTHVNVIDVCFIVLGLLSSDPRLFCSRA